MLFVLTVGLAWGNVASAWATRTGSSGTFAGLHEPSGARHAGEGIAFEVNGETTNLGVVIADLKALASNEALQVATVRDGGDLLPVPEVAATWITSLIYDRVLAQELERRGVGVTARQQLVARKLERHTYEPQARKALPDGFQSREIARTARAAALAKDEGLDVASPRGGRHLVDLVTELTRNATVVVAPRFGTWDPLLAVVVPPQEAGPSS